ncbi:hypothetical protein MTX78_14955 [Hymenobacter tibetensis]|uniref:Uncharacterized protein n=1 Tax=Hymenobacter tibetensis TaxID=497967 RepID=A0ABY4CUJ4_9BACT|nr:hypothetical protein [Hymenobacter tibetensis]UOG73422.1 hypothetical protein MTX78_14955 [Hymenobacter tibetensis]
MRQLGVLSGEAITRFLQGLRVHEGRIVVSSVEHAHWFSQQYAYLTEHYFAGAQSQSANLFLRGLIQLYYKTGQLTLDDFHQDDAHLLHRLHILSGQSVAAQYAAWVQLQSLGSPIATKPRRVDPEILIGKQVSRLSEL